MRLPRHHTLSFCLSLILAAGLPLHAQIAVLSETVQEQDAAPGARYSGTILVRNTSDRVQTVRVFQTDYSFQANGESRYDPRDPRFDRRMDPRHDPRLRAPMHLASGCRELRNGTDIGATRCAEQIEGMRRAFREMGAAIPSSCRVPDAPAAPTP